MYVIKRIDQGGGYLGAHPGKTGQTWVRNLQEAQLFSSRDCAEGCKCENEIVISVDSLLHVPTNYAS